MNYRKSIIANLLCVGLGAAVVWAVQGGSFGAAVLFVALLLWLCNELWHAALTLPGLLLAVWSTLRGKECPKAEKGVARAFSLLLLLVPHVLFALLYGAELLTGGQVSAWLGLPVSHGMFACAFVAPALLCLICLVSPVPPLSVVVLGAYLFEPELWTNQAPEHADAVQASLPPVPAAAGDAPRHPELQKLAGELVYYGRPVIGEMSPYSQRNVLVGAIMMGAGLLALAMAAAAYPESFLGAGMCLVLGLVFGGFGLRMVREPACWNARLRAAEFAFTRSHAYIAEGESVQVFPLDDSLDITLEEPAGKVGNIYLRQNDKMEAVIHMVYNRVKIHYDSRAVDTSAPLQGFLQIERAASVCRRLKECQARNRQGNLDS